MKNVLCLGFCMLVLMACNKSDVKNDNPNPIYNTPIAVTLDGLHDITIEQTDTVELPIQVSYVSGTKVKVSLAAINLPAGVNISIDPQIDTPSYNTLLRIVTNNADTVTKLITIVAASIDTSIDFPVVLKIVEPPVNAALELVGSYNETGNCTVSGSVNHSATVAVVAGYYNKIKIQGIWTSGNAYSVIANINPANHTVSVPAQQSGALTFSGSGTYTSSQISIQYHVTDGNVVNDDCTTVFTK